MGVGSCEPWKHQRCVDKRQNTPMIGELGEGTCVIPAIPNPWVGCLGLPAECEARVRKDKPNGQSGMTRCHDIGQ